MTRRPDRIRRTTVMSYFSEMTTFKTVQQVYKINTAEQDHTEQTEWSLLNSNTVTRPQIELHLISPEQFSVGVVSGCSSRKKKRKRIFTYWKEIQIRCSIYNLSVNDTGFMCFLRVTGIIWLFFQPWINESCCKLLVQFFKKMLNIIILHFIYCHCNE